MLESIACCHSSKVIFLHQCFNLLFGSLPACGLLVLSGLTILVLLFHGGFIEFVSLTQC
jgi:hypothetical protein